MKETAQDGWIKRLTSQDVKVHDDAVAELRQVLVKAASKTLTARYDAKLSIDDIVQEALIKILGALDKFEGRSQFITWAVAIATRVGLSELRKRHYSNVSLDGTFAERALQIEAPEFEHELADDSRKLVIDKLAELIETTLSPKQRTAIEASLDGLPAQEIADRLNSNRNAVYKLLHDGRTRLRSGLEEAGVTVDEVNTLFA